MKFVGCQVASSNSDTASLADWQPPPIAAMAGELQSPGTGPFFGFLTQFDQKALAENMDLYPSYSDFPILLAAMGKLSHLTKGMYLAGRPIGIALGERLAMQLEIRCVGIVAHPR